MLLSATFSISPFGTLLSFLCFLYLRLDVSLNLLDTTGDIVIFRSALGRASSSLVGLLSRCLVAGPVRVLTIIDVIDLWREELRVRVTLSDRWGFIEHLLHD